MHRIDSDGRYADKFGAGKDGFDNGTPGDTSTGTVLDDEFLDAVQEEICYVVEAGGGITLAKGNNTQLLTAIKNVFKAGDNAADAYYIANRSNHVNTPGASYSELWVNDASNRLIFTDDTGADHTIAHHSGFQTIAWGAITTGASPIIVNQKGYVTLQSVTYPSATVAQLNFSGGTYNTAGNIQVTLKQDPSDTVAVIADFLGSTAVQIQLRNSSGLVNLNSVAHHFFFHISGDGTP